MSELMDGNRLKNILISGKAPQASLVQSCTAFKLAASHSAVTAVDVTFQDDAVGTIERTAGLIPGATLTYGAWVMAIADLTIKAGQGGQVLTVSAPSKPVSRLMAQTGAKSWGTTDVSQWIAGIARSVGMVPIVQPGLGVQAIARTAGDQPQSTWDVMVEMRKRTGTWLFEYGPHLVFGRPSWLVKQNFRRTWALSLTDWDTYSDGLVAWPDYAFDPSADIKETLSFGMISADADRVRPGDEVTVTGRGAGRRTGQWIVTKADFPMSLTSPVRVECTRVIDPKIELPKTSTAATTVAGSTSKDVTLTGPIAGYGAEQLRNAVLIVKAGQKLGLNTHTLRLGVCCAMGESGLRNLGYGDAAGPDSRGLFQQRANGAWGSLSDRTNPTIAATNFFKALVKVPGYMSLAPTIAIHKTQINADPNHYAKYWSAAVQVVDAILAAQRNASTPSAAPGVSSAAVGAVDRFVASHQNRSWDYDGSYGAQCVDLFNFYNRDIVRGRFHPVNGAKDLWTIPTVPTDYVRITGTPSKGDVAIWGGNAGNGGWGHVAIVLEDRGSQLLTLSQNPGPARVMLLSKSGLLGYLRPRRFFG